MDSNTHTWFPTCSIFCLWSSATTWATLCQQQVLDWSRSHSLMFSPGRGAGFPPFDCSLAFSVSLLGTVEELWCPRTHTGTKKKSNGEESVENGAVWCNVRRWKTTLSFDPGWVGNTSPAAVGWIQTSCSAALHLPNLNELQSIWRSFYHREAFTRVYRPSLQTTFKNI